MLYLEPSRVTAIVRKVERKKAVPRTGRRWRRPQRTRLFVKEQKSIFHLWRSVQTSAIKSQAFLYSFGFLFHVSFRSLGEELEGAFWLSTSQYFFFTMPCTEQTSPCAVLLVFSYLTFSACFFFPGHATFLLHYDYMSLVCRADHVDEARDMTARCHCLLSHPVPFVSGFVRFYFLSCFLLFLPYFFP